VGHNDHILILGIQQVIPAGGIIIPFVREPVLVAGEGDGDYLKELDKNMSQYTKSGSAAPNGVALGEAAIALTFSHDGLQPTTEF